MAEFRQSELIIGANGFIGAALHKKIPDAATTTREKLNLLFLDIAPVGIVDHDIVYLCAGTNGAKRCEGNQDAFRVNVDATVDLARLCASYHAFMVYIGSMSVEWSDGAYQRQKLAAETILRTMKNVGIVRAGRVLKSNVDELCDFMIEVGRAKEPGLFRWGSDDIAYDGRRISR